MEIGWNIPTTVKTNSIKFTVSFTMHDVATKWKDVATFQWEPFGENNQVPIGTVTGTVHFPKGVTRATRGLGCTLNKPRKPAEPRMAASPSP
ncbi:DUF2207 domain-containing protein [Bifidobacterium longum]|uniref:DUF2207 domain-containing protein n=1 Tax=Bifidobacterium longum TaxID=216816 RepID=UPI002DD4329A|nr:DUF2207 domain-containing protein [Bifidobacterium longum]